MEYQERKSLETLLELSLERILLYKRFNSIDEIEAKIRLISRTIKIDFEEATNESLTELDYEFLGQLEIFGEPFWLTIYYAKTREMIYVTEICVEILD